MNASNRNIEAEHRVGVRMFGEDQPDEPRNLAEWNELEMNGAASEIVSSPRTSEWREHSEEWSGVAAAVRAQGINAVVEPDERRWMK